MFPIFFLSCLSFLSVFLCFFLLHSCSLLQISSVYLFLYLFISTCSLVPLIVSSSHSCPLLPSSVYSCSFLRTTFLLSCLSLRCLLHSQPPSFAYLLKCFTAPPSLHASLLPSSSSCLYSLRAHLLFWYLTTTPVCLLLCLRGAARLSHSTPGFQTLPVRWWMPCRAHLR